LGGVPITGEGGKNRLAFPIFSRSFTRYRDTTANRGSGSFLQTANVSRPDGQTWLVGTTPIARERTYTVAINDFLVSGRETNVGFLHLDGNPALTLVATHRDMGQVLIDQLRRHFGPP